MLVERELAIRRFVPEDYLRSGRHLPSAGAPGGRPYEGTWFRDRGGSRRDKESLQQAMRLPADGEEAQADRRRARAPGRRAIESIEAQTQRMPPPLLYDLTELQRHANRLFGFSAQKTLDTAQALYERHKLISYPRTDSRHLSQDVARDAAARSSRRSRRRIASSSRRAPASGRSGRRFVDDAKVTDHHAIIPTSDRPAARPLAPDERKIYDLICRRLLQRLARRSHLDASPP